MNAAQRGTVAAAALAASVLALAQETGRTALGTAVMTCAKAPLSQACDAAMRTVTGEAAERLAPYDAGASERCGKAAQGMISMEVTHRCHNAAVRAEHGGAPGAPERAALGARELRSECAAIAQAIGSEDSAALTEQCVHNARALLAERPPQADLRPVFEAECKAIEEISGRTMTMTRFERCERAAARAWIERSNPRTVAMWQARYRALVCSALVGLDHQRRQAGPEHVEEVARCMHVLELGR